MFYLRTGFTKANSVAVSDKITTLDRVTPTERQLFFTTAHTHFKNGCPFLALEVLSKLPPVVEAEEEKDHKNIGRRRLSLMEVGFSYFFIDRGLVPRCPCFYIDR